LKKLNLVFRIGVVVNSARFMPL